jgi:hypothetical protein
VRKFQTAADIEAADFDEHLEQLTHSRLVSRAAQVAPHSTDFDRLALEADLVAFDRDQVRKVETIDRHDGLDDFAE